METLERIRSLSDLYLGEVVYKKKESGDAGYDLPDKYKPGGKSYTGDINDYYHVGVVTSVSPYVITHCTSPGPIARDTKLGRWCCGGQLKGIEYNSHKKEETGTMKVVYGGNERAPINMRVSKSTSSGLIATIPQNTEVMVIDDDGEWCKIQYNNLIGYVKSEFVHDAEPQPDDQICVNRGKLEELYAELGELLGYSHG